MEHQTTHGDVELARRHPSGKVAHASKVKLVIEDEDDTGRGWIGHAGPAARALPLGRYPRERENGIITVVRTFCYK